MSTQRLAPTDPRTEVVTAPAGSGKTTLLLHHYLRHLCRREVGRIVAITFTRKAAAELVERLALVLNGIVDPAAIPASARAAHLARYGDVLPTPDQARSALAQLGAAPVSTVDAFTLSLVQQFLLGASFPLSDGRRALVDGPLSSGADNTLAWESAARAQLEALSADAKTVLAETGLGDAIADVAALARLTGGEVATNAGVLAALGEELAPLVKGAPDDWRDPAKGGKDPAAVKALAEASRWLVEPEGTPPVGLFRWVLAVKTDRLAKLEPAMAKALVKQGLPASATAALLDSKKKDHYSVSGAALKRADRVRAALVALAARARDEAHETIAREGRLGYDDLLLAATELCRKPTAALASRYDVLLVDELQDTNPAQLAFYEAFGAMRKGKDALARFFVGDARQSIFRFRHADPAGWVELVEAAREKGTLAELDVNYRSSRLLIDTQIALFEALRGAEAFGVEPLDGVAAAKDAPEGLLEGELSAPVLVVDDDDSNDVDPHVLALFARRVRERWATHPDESAAVLCHSWVGAQRAAAFLRLHEVEAQLTGERTLLESQVATDLRSFLRALLDGTDDIALASVLKHPSVGVSDRGLLLLRAGGGLGRVFLPDPPLAELSGADRVALQSALPLLRAARARMGREGTADLLEWLVTALRWRPVIAAGPEGERGVGLAQLDVLLDLVRQAEADRVDPRAAVEAIDPEMRGLDDLPLVRLTAPRKVVTVTTVFAAKGLEFDHVALVETHKEAADGVSANTLFRAGRPRGMPFLGVFLDPEGGLDPKLDPVAVLGNAACLVESKEETYRLFYVGFTRAIQSVTMGLKSEKRSPTTAALRLALRVAAAKDLGSALRFVAPAGIEVLEPHRPIRGRTGRVAAFSAAWVEAPGHALARPSDAQEHLSAPDFAAAVEALRTRSRIVEGPRAPPLPAVPGLDAVAPAALGDVVHGWLERWQFAGTPDPASARAYLAERWNAADARLAAWLVELGLLLRDGLPGFAELLSRAERLHFEWPLLGIEPELVWAGRTDLVVELPRREVVVLDFKAGAHFAHAGNIPGLEAYAAQLEAYRRVLTSASYRVSELGLVYVRGVSWVRNELPALRQSSVT
jgi:ATP-dependent helicase/nuclease subunit A